MADKKKMSVEDVLAACRQTDGGGGAASGSTSSADAAESKPDDASAKEPASPAPSNKPTDMSTADILAAARSGQAGGKKPEPKAQPASSGSKAAKPAAGKPSGDMSVADILAAARGEKSGATKGAGKPQAGSKPAAPKSATKPEKASPKAAAPSATEALDTSSILAAARKSTKRGPMSKAEAAAKSEVGASSKPKPSVPAMPEKPAYARPKVAERRTDDDRRGFITVLVGSFLAVGFSSMSAVFGLWTLGFARFMFPNILTEPPNQFKVGFPGDFAPGTVTTKFKAQFGVWIINAVYDGQPQIAALKTVCTHLGCTPNWLEAEQKFKCPCHGSGFYKDGINFEGPAPRPLERYAIRLADDGQLEVDKSRLFQEEMGQWRDAASFVSA